MPRPQTKSDLLLAAESQYGKLLSLIDSLPANRQGAVFTFGTDFSAKEPHWRRDKNLRDVLAHLHQWQIMLLDFVNANMQGNPQKFLPAEHTWKSTPALNQDIWELFQATTLAQSKELLADSHSRVMTLIDSFDNDTLFTKKYFPWTGSTSLGSYCVSATSSHYDWAIKKLRTVQKAWK